jgi:hypothetical protein
VRRTIASEPRKKGGILAALLRSPLMRADLDVTRSTTPGRIVKAAITSSGLTLLKRGRA